MKNKLLHKDVFMFEKVNNVVCKLESLIKNYELTKHMEEHLTTDEDRSHCIDRELFNKALEYIRTNEVKPFEVEISYGQNNKLYVTKYCCRVPYSEKQDISVVFRPFIEDNKYVIKNVKVITAYVNSNEDLHNTLDISKYASEEEFKNFIKENRC